MLVKFKALAVFMSTDELDFRVRDTLSCEKGKHLMAQEMGMH